MSDGVNRIDMKAGDVTPSPLSYGFTTSPKFNPVSAAAHVHGQGLAPCWLAQSSPGEPVMATRKEPKHARSRQGCWTCRTRRKKCDERRPQCGVCERSRRQCEGYGTRLVWPEPRNTGGTKGGSVTSPPMSVSTSATPSALDGIFCRQVKRSAINSDPDPSIEEGLLQRCEFSLEHRMTPNLGAYPVLHISRGEWAFHSGGSNAMGQRLSRIHHYPYVLSLVASSSPCLRGEASRD